MTDRAGDSLGAGLDIEAFGVGLGIEVRAPELRAEVEIVLPPGWTPLTGGEPVARFVLERADTDRYHLTKDGQPVAGPLDGDVAVKLLDSRIRIEIAGAVVDRTFVHAGVVAVGDRAIVLPGRSFAGKTTLVATLIESGATYLSDEYAVLDDAGLVHPYPRRLSMREPGALRGPLPAPTRELSAASFGAPTSDVALEIGLVAILTYRHGGAWQVEERTRAEGALAMLSNAATARKAPELVLAQVRAATRRARVIEGERGEAPDAASRLLELLDAEVLPASGARP
jgi:hypothetical protein